MASGPALRTVLVHDDPAAWRALGFHVEEDGSCQVGATTLRIAPGEPGGLVGWELFGDPFEDALDGIPTTWTRREAFEASARVHENGARRVDHVVVLTPDVERTVAALEAAGMVLRREREFTAPDGRAARQAFFRHGEAIVEVGGPAEPEGDAPARLWGVTVEVQDVDGLAERLGPERCGAAKDAVQPGRRFATLRRGAGLAVPVGLISPG